MGLRANLLRTVLADLPNRDSMLTEPSARWDELLGGRTGPDSWNHYGRGFGTSCIVVNNGWAIDAGFPDDMVVKVPTPNGGGTKMQQAFNNGAKARGWLRTPVRGQLPDIRPGDVVNLNHATSDGSDGTHVGVVVRVTPIDDRTLEVETADGGQGPRQKQSAARNVRKFQLSDGPHAVVVQSPSGPGWLDRWIAVGGDEEDDDLQGPGGSSPTESSTGVVVAAVVAGVAFLFAGLMLYGPPPSPFRLFAVREDDRLVANAYGKRKAERFRGRFGLDTASFQSLDPEYADAHDYVHTVLGALPGPWDDELRVLQYEEDVRAGRVSKPRGLLALRQVAQEERARLHAQEVRR